MACELWILKYPNVMEFSLTLKTDEFTHHLKINAPWKEQQDFLWRINNISGLAWIVLFPI